MAAFSSDGAEFVEMMRERTAPFRDIKLRTTDLVHGDLNPSNIFLLEGRISAVVDVEALGKGSRFHDLATLLVYARLGNAEPAACDVLLGYARRNAAPGELEVSFAACLLGLLEFMTHHHAENAVTALRSAAELL